MKNIYMLLAATLLMVITSCGGGGGSDPIPPPPSSVKVITAFYLDGVDGTINETVKTIAVTMPYRTSVTALVATFTTTGASVKVGSTIQVSGTTANNFTSPVVYTVTAADATTQDYTVTVTVALLGSLSSAKAIRAFSLAGVVGTINETGKTIAVTMPFGTPVTNLVATFTTTGASVKVGSTIQVSGTTANNFTSPVVYTVTAADATTRNYTVTVTIEAADYTSANIGTLKYVPAGSFQRDGTPANISTITTAFRMSEYEITQAQYVAVTTTANPSWFIGATLPVEQVTWFDAVEFCNDLSTLEGLTPVYTITSRIPSGVHPITSATVTATWSNNGYRLPTEMEWMWAAMGATSGSGWTSPTYLTGYAKPFAGSNATNAAGDNGTNFEGVYAWIYEYSGTKPVGIKLPNELGLYDMSGNVWEWVWDWYDDYPGDTLTDFRGAASGPDRILRGGGWDSFPSGAAVAVRVGPDPNSQYASLGFRVVRP
jgi:formylglycine-generating enzyme required for sulfatase activity